MSRFAVLASGATVGALTGPLVTVSLFALVISFAGSGLLGFEILAAMVWTVVSVFPGIVAGGAAGLVHNVFVSAGVGAIVFAVVPLGWVTLLKLGGEPVDDFVLWATPFACIVGLVVGAVAGFIARRKTGDSPTGIRLSTIFLLVAGVAGILAWIRWLALSTA